MLWCCDSSKILPNVIVYWKSFYEKIQSSPPQCGDRMESLTYPIVWSGGVVSTLYNIPFFWFLFCQDKAVWHFSLWKSIYGRVFCQFVLSCQLWVCTGLDQEKMCRIWEETSNSHYRSRKTVNVNVNLSLENLHFRDFNRCYGQFCYNVTQNIKICFTK